MDEANNREARNEHQRQAIAHEFRLSLRGQNVPTLLTPPTSVYTDQVLSLHLFRRLNNFDYNFPSQSKKIEFLDRTGHLTIDGINVDLGELEIKITSPNWNIHIPAERNMIPLPEQSPDLPMNGETANKRLKPA